MYHFNAKDNDADVKDNNEISSRENKDEYSKPWMRRYHNNLNFKM